MVEKLKVITNFLSISVLDCDGVVSKTEQHVSEKEDNYDTDPE